MLLHFHGWKRQGTLIVRHGRISGATRRRGVLLLAPNGRNRTWDFRDPDSADVDFATAVIEDAARRYPIDRSRIYVSGYSYGGRGDAKRATWRRCARARCASDLPAKRARRHLAG